MEQEKIDWFNKLPVNQRADEGDKFERVCPCGATVWYDFADRREHVKSWVEIHFGHTADVKPEKKPFAYDWSIAWKFSYLGLLELIKEFKLREFVPAETYGNILAYQDPKKNFYLFQIVDKTPNLNFPDENHYVSFLPKNSSITL